VRLSGETRVSLDGDCAGRIVAHVDAPSAEAAAAAAAAIRSHLAPADPGAVGREVAAVQAVSARRTESIETVQVTLRVYVGALTAFPIDVVSAMAQRFIQRRGKGNWFPELGEMLKACDELVAPRLALLRALEGWRPKTVAEMLHEEADVMRSWASEAEDRAFEARIDGDAELRDQLAAFAAFARRERRALWLQAREAEQGCDPAAQPPATMRDPRR
jgi:hypothetical protein